jgi:adenylate cyclase
MSDVFISYARSTAARAEAVAAALRALGHQVWSDDELPAHRDYSEVIEERLRSAKAVVVLWSSDAATSQWVRAEAEIAREAGTLVQATLDGAKLPMPFSRIQCADLRDWSGDLATPGWRKVAGSVAELAAKGAPLSSSALAPAAIVAARAEISPVALPSLASKPAILVMPLISISGEPDRAYVADGITEEIITSLTRFRHLTVIAGASTVHNRTEDDSSAQSAAKVGARYLLEGSVRTVGARVRVSMNLVDTNRAAQIWSERFDEPLDDVLALQDRLARAIVGNLVPRLRTQERQRSMQLRVDGSSAYELYLRALQFTQVRNRANIHAALELLDPAIATEPDFTDALGLAADCHRTIVQYGWSDNPDENRRRGLELARRAVKVGDDDADVLVDCARIQTALGGELDSAISLVDRALELNPASAYVWLVSGSLRRHTGDLGLAARHIETALQLSPTGNTRISGLHILASIRFAEGRYAESARLEREYVHQSESPAGYATLAACYGLLGQLEPARDALTRFRELCPMPLREYAAESTEDPVQAETFLRGLMIAAGDSLA